MTILATTKSTTATVHRPAQHTAGGKQFSTITTRRLGLSD